MNYLYGVMSASALATDLSDISLGPGISGEVEMECFDDLVVIHAAHDGSEILPRRKSLLAHARVLENAMDHGTVLPMRFGMVCDSVAAFAALAARHRADIQAAFDRLSGCVEMGVRVTASETEALNALLDRDTELRTARDRLAEKGRGAHFSKVEFGRALGEAMAARRAAAQKDLVERLRPMARDYLIKAPESDFQVLRGEFLIERERLEEFGQGLEVAVQQLGFVGGSHWDIRMVGPGPAFHFVGLTLDPADAEAAA